MLMHSFHVQQLKQSKHQSLGRDLDLAHRASESSSVQQHFFQLRLYFPEQDFLSRELIAQRTKEPSLKFLLDPIAPAHLKYQEVVSFHNALTTSQLQIVHLLEHHRNEPEVKSHLPLEVQVQMNHQLEVPRHFQMKLCQPNLQYLLRDNGASFLLYLALR